MPAEEFYLTNTLTDYLLCFNHHDYLIACGRAREWLTAYSARRIRERAVTDRRPLSSPSYSSQVESLTVRGLDRAGRAGG